MRQGKPLARTSILQLYRDAAIPFHRTDYLGSVRVIRQGDALVVSNAREAQGIAHRRE